MKSDTKKIFRLSKRYSGTILVLFFATLTLYSLHSFMKHANTLVKSTLFSCPIVDISCANFYSPQIKRKIVSFVQSYESNANYLSFNAANFYSDLKEHFDCVTKVTITKRLPMGFCIQIKGVNPVMLINDTCVLAADRGVYTSDDFQTFTGLETLPHLTIPAITSGMKIASTAYNDLKTLATEYNKDYVCTYYDSSLIRLKPRKKTLYTSILTNNATFHKGISSQMLDDVVADSLRRGLCSQKSLDKKTQSIELDMRFAQRIIVKVIDHGKRGRGV